MSLLDVTFPIKIAKGSTGGPVYSTDVVKTGSGARYANINWDSPDYEYDVSTGIRSVQDLISLTDFFHIVKGQGHGFRFPNFTDWKSCGASSTIAADDQVIVADATAGQATAQLVKTYTSGSQSTSAVIMLPIAGTTILEKNGDPFTSGWSINAMTGLITFSPGLTLHDVITAGYHYDLPMCFATDKLPRTFESYRTGTIRVPIVTYR